MTTPLLYRSGFPPPATRLPWPLFSSFFLLCERDFIEAQGFLEGFRALSLFFAFGFLDFAF